MANRKTLANWRSDLATRVPAPLGRAFYYGLFILLRLWVFMRMPALRVWPRNSLVLGPVQFALSDIDLTVIARRPEDVKRFRSLIRPFVLVREVNGYLSSLLPELLGIVNPVELKRDPHLLNASRNYSGVESRTCTPEHQLTFLLRMFEACSNQFSGHALWQEKKWRSYFLLADQPAFPRTTVEFYFLVDRLAKRCRCEIPLETLLKQVIEFRANRTFHDLPSKSERDFVWLQTLFPHRFCFLPAKLPSPAPEIMRAQMEWEFWGILTQNCGQPSEGEIAHLKRMLTLASASAIDIEAESPLMILSKTFCDRSGSSRET